MGAGDAERLVGVAVATAVQLLETQDGLLLPIAHAIDAHGRCRFLGTYDGIPDPACALDALREAVRRKPYRSATISYGIAMPDRSNRNALCIEFESLDAAAETIIVPFVITRPRLRTARVFTYAPVHQPGINRIFGRPSGRPGTPD